MERKKRQERRFIVPISVLALAAFAGAAPSPQDSDPRGPQPLAISTEQGSAARFLVHSDLVLVPVTVTTGNGKVVLGLEKQDFSVFDERVQQEITHFTSEDAPASIGFVFDSSGSMGPRLAKAKEAVFALLHNANPGDEFFLVRFSSHPELLVPLTSNPEGIRRAAETIDANGSTALLDAVKLAWDEMSKAKHSRKALVIISDGEDNSSRMTTDEFRRLASENDTTIYSLYIGDFPDNPDFRRWSRLNGAGLLEDIAKQTGGSMFVVNKLKRLPEIAAKIGSWVRSQYVLGYVPQHNNPNGGYHRIQVKISKPEGFPRLHSVWRLGYLAPQQ